MLGVELECGAVRRDGPIRSRGDVLVELADAEVNGADLGRFGSDVSEQRCATLERAYATTRIAERFEHAIEILRDLRSTRLAFETRREQLGRARLIVEVVGDDACGFVVRGRAFRGVVDAPCPAFDEIRERRVISFVVVHALSAAYACTSSGFSGAAR